VRPKHFRRPINVALVVSSFFVLVAPAPASADLDGGGGGNVFVDATTGPNGPEIVLTGVAAGSSVVGPGLPEWMRACSWTSMSFFEYDLYAWQRYSVGDGPVYDDYVSAGFDPDEPWAVVLCSTTDPDVVAQSPTIAFTGILDAWPIGDPVPQFVQDWIVARAAASVVLPVSVGTSAPAGDVNAPMITQFPTWLWIEAGEWQPRSATPAAVFGTTATVTATPYEVIYRSDGQIVSCGNNSGSVYNFALREEQQSTNCSLTWKHSSAVGSYTLDVTIRWSVSWVCNQYCGSGTLPDFVVTTSRPVRVAELQAVGVAPGG